MYRSALQMLGNASSCMYKHVEKACDRREHMIDEKLINIYIFGIDQSSREKLNIEMDI